MTEDELRIVRCAFARQMIAVSGVGSNPQVEAALATVRREDFLGSDPWMALDPQRSFVRMPANDPVYVYQDVMFVLSPSRGINNGGPSLHVRMLAALGPQPGDRVVHLGAGTGYYSAILAHLVGRDGTVTAIEIDPYLGRGQGTISPDSAMSRS